MKNYQLYRTNIALGGQMKHDVVLGNIDGELLPSKLYLSTIDDPSGVMELDNAKIYSGALSNIKRFYQTYKSRFYSTYNEQSFIMTDKPTPYNRLNCGLKLSKYSIYKKKYEYFCPLWLEKCTDMMVYFDVYCGGSLICTTPLDWTFTKKTNSTPYENYIYQYIKMLGLNSGCDNVLNIDLFNHIGMIEGIDVMNGVLKTKDISHIVSNILMRERPVMEFDNMLSSQFESNEMITKQLLNLSFHFDLEDIIPAGVHVLFDDGDINIRVRVKVDGNVIEMKDFFSNYEYIPREMCGPVLNKGGVEEFNGVEPNVLSYLHDDECVDLVSKNKIVQNTTHWSMCDNNSYIFNLYDGFSGYSIDKDGNIEIHTHQYGKAPDLSVDQAQPLGNIGWCNYISVNYSGIRDEVLKQVNRFLSSTNTLFEYSCNFAQPWVNNIRYGECDWNDDINVLLVHNNTKVEDGDPISVNTWRGKIGWPSIVSDGVMISYIRRRKYFNKKEYRDTHYFFVFADDISNLTYQKFIRVATKSFYDNGNVARGVLDRLFKRISKANNSSNPPVYTQYNTLALSRADSPSLSSSEIEYIKRSEKGPYLLRYSGKITPTFISPGDKWFNYRYTPRYISPEEWKGSSYSRYYKSGYMPVYPSVGYYNFDKKVEDYDWVKTPIKQM